MRPIAPVVIVGASAAGLAAAAAIAAAGFADRVTVIGDETESPYSRPPLSKSFLAAAESETEEPSTLAADLTSRGVTFVYGTKAIGLDVARQRVRIRKPGWQAAGPEMPYGSMVIATGTVPRFPFGTRRPGGTFTLRTRSDARAFRTSALASRHVVIVGAGLIGTEVAATLTSLGTRVTLIASRAGPLGYLHAGLGPYLAKLHTRHGVQVIQGPAVELLADRGSVTGVRLANGSLISTTCVLVATGGSPATEWLRGSGIPVNDGVRCDAHSLTAPGVYAAGDVARWWHRRSGRPIRLENQQNAICQGTFVGEAILGSPETYDPVPFGWTHQYHAKLQTVGVVGAGDHTGLLVEATGTDSFVLVESREGSVTAAITWNAPTYTRLARRWIANGTSVDDLTLSDVATLAELTRLRNTA